MIEPQTITITNPSEFEDKFAKKRHQDSIKESIDKLVKAAFFRKYRLMPTSDIKFGMSKKKVKGREQLNVYHKKQSGQLLKIGIIEVIITQDCATFKLLDNEKEEK